jgi:hypothetical protein
LTTVVVSNLLLFLFWSEMPLLFIISLQLRDFQFNVLLLLLLKKFLKVVSTIASSGRGIESRL